MFLLPDGTVVYSASDLAVAAECEFALLRGLDVRLGRAEPLDLPVDPIRERAAVLGDEHEHRVLTELIADHGPWDLSTGRGVFEVERPDGARATDPVALHRAHETTIEALRAGADVVFQGGFFDGRFGGWSDFLVRVADGVPRYDGGAGARAGAGGAGADGPAYAVHDTKLARHAKVTALLQLAAYADQMLAADVPVAAEVHLVLGDRSRTSHRLADLLPVYRERRGRLERLVDDHQASGAAVAWDDPAMRACGRCDVCAPEVERRRDLLLVASLRATQRARLRAVGITTVEELAASTEDVPGMPAATLTKLRRQAQLQADQDAAGPDSSDVVDVHHPRAILDLPEPDPGDVFFDFEGDPLWAPPQTVGTTEVEWGLEYLFGLVEAPVGDDTPVFRAFWAHDRAQEKQALVDFLAYVRERRAAHPGMHIYHYAPYERTALLRLAARHGVGEDEVDELLRAGVLVDLYATVRRSLRIGRRSYSLKTLETIYMGDHGRSGEVQSAASSIEEYALACAARDEGDLAEWDRRITELGAYNEYDCVSTLRLRDWLRGLVEGVPGEDDGPAQTALLDGAGADERSPEPPHPVVGELRAVADAPAAADADGVRTPDQQALAMLAAAVDYHRREDKPFWWAHFDRLSSEPADWTDRRSTFLADPGTVTVVVPWHQPEGARGPLRPRRRVRMVGRLEPGSELKEGVGVCALYEGTLPDCAKTSSTGHRGWTTGTVVAVTAEGEGLAARDVLVVEEVLPRDAAEHPCLPMALGPGFPPSTGGIARTITAVAVDVAGAVSRADGVALPPGPALDVLRRVPPRVHGDALPRAGDGTHSDDTAAITAALRALTGSYLAVQGPPGTGKTYTGAHVIAALVTEGWRVAVVAQSHAVVEHMLDAVIDAGVAPERVGKRPAGSAQHTARWTALGGPAAFRAFHGEGSGSVMGGTTWDLVNADRLPADPFDLVVVDEAGQFSLANTIAVAAAGRNLLLLGDPQQLPQVSKGVHPEPVDRSALGWLVDGHETLPTRLGYFLARTWRMHPALTDVVSRLSYEDRLRAMPHTAERSLERVAPGVRVVLVEHDGNAVASEEEAAAVVAEVRAVVGRRWQDPQDGTDRPLTDADVIVVAAYNAQVWTVRRALDAAGLTGTTVGTVDKFQGRQAPVAIMTTAASSPDDVPRGMEFLLNRNRLNVALSRGQWCAVLVRSSAITDHLPRHPDRLAELGAFIGVGA